jgi:hypothetical protein
MKTSETKRRRRNGENLGIEMTKKISKKYLYLSKNGENEAAENRRKSAGEWRRYNVGSSISNGYQRRKCGDNGIEWHRGCHLAKKA